MSLSAHSVTAHPIRPDDMDWIPLRDGISFKPLHFAEHGYALQLRVEPGVTVTRHRHTGEVHAYNLSGAREIIDTGEILGPGVYIHEPVGNCDSWRCVGDEPCIVHISLTGRVEYLGDDGEILNATDSETACEAYLRWCAARGVAPNPSLAPECQLFQLSA